MELDDFDALPPDELLGKDFDDPNMVCNDFVYKKSTV